MCLLGPLNFSLAIPSFFLWRPVPARPAQADGPQRGLEADTVIGIRAAQTIACRRCSCWRAGKRRRHVVLTPFCIRYKCPEAFAETAQEGPEAKNGVRTPLGGRVGYHRPLFLRQYGVYVQHEGIGLGTQLSVRIWIGVCS